jgi:hypothetical protein
MTKRLKDVVALYEMTKGLQYIMTFHAMTKWLKDVVALYEIHKYCFKK